MGNCTELYLQVQLNRDKSNSQGKQKFVQLIEGSTYRGLQLEV